MRMKLLLFAGTTEGRRLAEALLELPVNVYVSTATRYGKECIKEGKSIKVIAGRMDRQAMAEFMTRHQIDLTIDATHPFATEVTDNIKNACACCRTEYIRCLRDMEPLKPQEQEGMVITGTVQEAVDYLKEKKGRIFIATGSKELVLYTQIPEYEKRCYARVLSTKEAVEESAALGFKGAHLIAMQGPFSKELNVAMLRYTQAKYFVTKESGKNGGFEEKVKAAKKTGAVLIVVGRPVEEGMSLQETLAHIHAKLKD